MNARVWCDWLNGFSRRPLLLDANVLLLCFVGCGGTELIARHPRLSDYRREHFELLAQIVEHFSRTGTVYTTAHILTEVCNLSEKLHGEQRTRFFALVADQLRVLKEQTEPSWKLARLNCFSRLGLTDAAITDLAAGMLTVLSDDGPLVAELRRQHRKVIHFKHDLCATCL